MIGQYQTFAEKAFLLLFKISSEEFVKKLVEKLQKNNLALKIAESFFSIRGNLGSIDSRLTRLPLCIDVLGEYAKTKADAIDYLRAVLEVVDCCPADSHVAIKLSALWPFSSITQLDSDIFEMLEVLVSRNSSRRIFTIFDAEDRFTNERVLHLLSSFSERSLIGLCVQAYWCNLGSITRRIEALSKNFNVFSVRIVKGAYYSTEKGLTLQSNSNYDTTNTLQETERNLLELLGTFTKLGFQVAVGTHNVDTIKAILCEYPKTEIQTLLGVGTGLAFWLQDLGYNVRIYAPISSKNSLPFLIRRFNENTNVSRAFSLLSIAALDDQKLDSFP